MADGGSSGASGILGVIIGAILVVVVGFAVLSYTGNLNLGPSKSVDVNVKLPGSK
jgi:uncharacterized membrane protein YkvI